MEAHLDLISDECLDGAQCSNHFSSSVCFSRLLQLPAADLHYRFKWLIGSFLMFFHRLRFVLIFSGKGPSRMVSRTNYLCGMRLPASFRVHHVHSTVSDQRWDCRQLAPASRMLDNPQNSNKGSRRKPVLG